MILNTTSRAWLTQQLQGVVTSGKSNLLYRGSRDGYTNAIFNSRCANKGATLTVVMTTKGVTFGGFA